MKLNNTDIARPHAYLLLGQPQKSANIFLITAKDSLAASWTSSDWNINIIRNIVDSAKPKAVCFKCAVTLAGTIADRYSTLDAGLEDSMSIYLHFQLLNYLQL